MICFVDFQIGFCEFTICPICVTRALYFAYAIGKDDTSSRAVLGDLYAIYYDNRDLRYTEIEGIKDMIFFFWGGGVIGSGFGLRAHGSPDPDQKPLRGCLVIIF